MAKQTSLFLHSAQNVGTITFVNADSTTAKTLITAGTNDSDLKAIHVTSTDTGIVLLRLYDYDGTTSFLLGTFSIPIAAGTDGTTPTRNLINITELPGLLLDPVSKPYRMLKAGHSIKIAPVAAVTSAKTVTIIAEAYDY